jgi:hypothetical protein
MPAADCGARRTLWRQTLPLLLDLLEALEQLRGRGSGRVLLVREPLEDRDLGRPVLALSVDNSERLVRGGRDAEALGARLGLGRIDDLEQQRDRRRLVADVAEPPKLMASE